MLLCMMQGVGKCFCDAYHQVAVLHSLAIPLRCRMSPFGVLVGMLIGVFISFC